MGSDPSSGSALVRGEAKRLRRLPPRFFSAFGYWASSCVGNVTYWILIMTTVGAIWPALGEGRRGCRPVEAGAVA